MNPEQTNTDQEALTMLSIEANDKLDSIDKTAEANLLETSKVKDAIEGLEPSLDAIALNTQPKEVQKIEIINGDNELAGKFFSLLKGKDGKTPKKGVDYFTPKEITEFRENIKENLKKEVLPIKGKDYFTQKEIDNIVDEVFSKIPTPENGKTPKRGVDYFTDADIRNFVYDVLIRIPTPKNGKDADEDAIYKKILKKIPELPELKPETAEEIATRLNTLSKAIDFKVIKNFPDYKKSGGGPGYLYEISDVEFNNLTAGDLIKWNGRKWINVTPQSIEDVRWGEITGTLSHQTDLQNALNEKEVNLTFSTGLTRTVDTITANISTGVSGGQTAIGGTGASENLTLSSTSNATKGSILFGSTASYNEANSQFLAPNGSVTAPAYSFGSATGIGMYNSGGIVTINSGSSSNTMLNLVGSGSLVRAVISGSSSLTSFSGASGNNVALSSSGASSELFLQINASSRFAMSSTRFAFGTTTYLANRLFTMAVNDNNSWGNEAYNESTGASSAMWNFVRSGTTGASSTGILMEANSINFSGNRFGISRAGMVALTSQSAYSGTNKMAIGSELNIPLHFATNDIVRMTVSDGGLVGIGTSSPSGSALHIFGNTSNNMTSIKLEDNEASGSRTWRIGASTGPLYGDFNIQQSTTKNGSSYSSRFYINPSGYVGIGTTEPGTKLHISDATGGILTIQRDDTGVLADDLIGAISFYQNDNSNPATMGSINMYASTNNTGASSTNSHLTFSTTAANSITEKVRITSTGNVGIGTTTPTAVLHLKAGTATASTAPLKFTSGTNLTTPEAGAVEWDGTSLFFTRTGTTREIVGTVVTKTDTGDGTGAEGLFQINTFDNTFKVYADGGWRELANW